MMVFGIGFGSSLLWKALSILFIAALPVRVTTSAGDTVEGELSGLSESALWIDRDGAAIELSFDELLSLQPSKVDSRVGPVFRVTLLGGSNVAAQDLSLVEDTLVIEPRRQEPLRLNVKEVKSIRFRAATPTTDPQWLGLMEQPGRGDVLAIRREGDRMDPYRGVIQSITEGSVSFDMEGDAVNAPVDKLEGVIFGGNRQVVEDAEIRVTDVYGSTWAAIAILPSESDQPLKLKLNNSLIHEVPLQQIESIRWSSGLQLLASAEAAERSFKPYFQTKVDRTLIEQWFAPSAGGDSDLRMQGDCWIDYRVQPGFTTLVGSVRRDDSVVKAGEVSVSILIDDQVRWKESIKGTSLLGFNLPVENARRVRIEVDSGDDGDLGDTVRIIRPRFVK